MPPMPYGKGGIVAFSYETAGGAGFSFARIWHRSRRVGRAANKQMPSEGRAMAVAYAQQDFRRKVRE